MTAHSVTDSDSRRETNGWVCLHPQDNATDSVNSKHNFMVSLDNRGLSYADGFFTTMGVIDGQILWQGYHQQRLISHAKALQLDLDSHALLTILKAYAEQLQQGMMKIIVTRAAQVIRGYGYTSAELGSACEIWLKSLAMTVSTAEWLSLDNGSVVPVQPISTAVCLSSQIACLPPPLAGLKSLNRLDNVLASGELQAIKANTAVFSTEPDSADIGEGLLRDMSGCWVEGTMSNVFYRLSEPTSLEPQSSKSDSLLDLNKNDSNYLTKGQWYTPSMAQSGVAGVMRQVIIDALSTSKHPVIIRSLQDEDLPRLSQLFFCNALRGIMPMNNLTLLSGEVVGF